MTTKLTPLNINALKVETYNPEALLAHAWQVMHLTSDYRLSRRLGVCASLVSRIRYKRIGVSSEVLLRLHDETGTSIRKLKHIAGLPSVGKFKGEDNA